ncbi:MAG: hypothetical protein ACXWBO_10335 [Ilumatobacteraceae bacterium]
MFNIPQLPSIDFPSIDLSRFDVGALRNSTLSKRLSEIDIPSIDTDKVTALVRDAAYLTVGLGVVAVQQVRGLIRNAA